jgi:hypothetical protein
MCLFAEVAVRSLVERHRQRRPAMRPQAHESEATPEVPAEHG